MREASRRLAQGVISVSRLICEKSERSWPERVLPFHLVPYWMVTPSNWSLEQQTIDMRLPGRELRLGNTDWQ
jgi:ribosomal protein L16 Arg81 hydroxylase